MIRRLLVVALVAALVASVGVVHANDPRFETSVPEPELRAGATQPLTIELTNNAEEADERVAPATEVEVSVEGAGPIEVDSGNRSLGTLVDGDPRSVTVSVDVPANAPGGTYRLPVRIDYVHDGDRKSTTLNATVRVEERARFRAETRRTTARIGGDGSLVVDVTNVGERRAEAAQLTLTADTPVLGFEGAPSASRFVDGLAPGETRSVAFDLSVGESANGSEYSLDAVVRYDTVDGAVARSRTLTVGVTPRPEQTFRVDRVDGSIRVGEDGEVTLAVTNTGPAPVEAAVVALTAGGSVSVPTPEVAIGGLAPGETRTVDVEVRAAESASPGPRQFSARVLYRDADGDRRRGDAADVPARVLPERTFTARVANATLRSGQEGSVTVTVTNEGPGPARDAVVTLATGAGDLTLLESEVAVGSIPANATRTVSFDVEATDDARAGARQFDARVNYRTADGTERSSDQLAVRADVAAGTPDFAVDSRGASIAPGETAIVNLTVTNRRGEPVSDVSAKLFADAPLSADDANAFVERLAPGETATVRFRLSVDSAAIVDNTYAVEVDFQFQTPEGDTIISDTYRAPIRIGSAGSGGGGLPSLPIIGGTGLALLALVGAAVYLRR